MDKATVNVTQWPYGMWVGCKRDAIKAARGELRYLDGGFCRETYVNAAGTVVYKVAVRDNRANESEYRRMVKMASDPEIRAITTPTALYDVDGVAVVAMVFRPGDGGELTDRQRQKMQRLIEKYNRESGDWLGDMHMNNYRGTPAGRATVTDAGDVI